MIEIQHLSKSFGPIRAVDDLSFSVSQGEVLGFLGPNGAGKSTTMKMITGFLGPSGGTARVCGHDVTLDPIAAKRVIGYLPEGAPLYPDMTPARFLDFIADVRGLSGDERARRMADVIARVHLEGVMHQRIETLSKGFKRRVGLAQAILHDPPVLILDEPTDGLDPNQKHEVRALIREMAREKAIVLSTHILEEVEAVCSRAIIIARGKIVFDGTPASLVSRSRFHNAVALTLRAPSSAEVQKRLAAIEGVSSVEEISQQDGQLCYRIFPERGRAILGDLSERLRASDWEVDDLHVEAGRLDEVFRELTAGSGARRS